MYAESLPSSSDELDRFAAHFRPALQLVLSAHTPPAETLSVQSGPRETVDGFSYLRHQVERTPGTGLLEVESLTGNRRAVGNALMVFPDTMGSLAEPDSKVLEKTIDSLLSKGFNLFRAKGFASGQARIPKADWESFSWPDAYNRSNQLSGVQDILLAISLIDRKAPGLRLRIIGLGSSGVQTAFAAAVSGRAEDVLLDLDSRDPAYDGELLELMPVGAIKRVGDFRTAVLLLLQNKISLLNPGPTFDKDWYRARAKELGLSSNLTFPEGLPQALGL